MPLDRRQLLTVLGIASLAGCAPDPTIHGDPAHVAPAEPTQGPAVVELATALAGLQRAIGDEPDPWRGAATAQVEEWGERLRLLEPLEGGDPHFPAPTAGTTEGLAEALTATTTAALRAAESAEGQAMRLLHLSILAGATGLGNTALPPVTDGAAPARFVDVPTSQVLPVTLSHVLALLQGLERGLGLLGRDAPAKEQVATRRGEVRLLRNRITEAIGSNRPLQDAHYELPPIDATTFGPVWAGLELAVLGGLLGLAATQDSWVDPAVSQVSKAQAAGAQLPTWPGWVSGPTG